MFLIILLSYQPCAFFLLTNALVYVIIQCCVVMAAVQNANVVKITDFGLAKFLPPDQDVFKAVGGKVCQVL